MPSMPAEVRAQTSQVPPDGPPEALAGERAPSLRRNSMARMASDVSALAIGMGAAVITARWLGPADKGIFLTLTFVTAIGALLATLGLGDAAIVELNQRRTPFQDVLGASLAALLIGCLAAVLIAAALLALQFADIWDQVAWPVAVSVAGMVPAAASTVLSGVLNASERVVLTSAVALLTGVVSTGLLVLLVVVLHAGLLGAAISGPASEC